MVVLINQMVGILWQCILYQTTIYTLYILKFVDYISKKLEKEKKFNSNL